MTPENVERATLLLRHVSKIKEAEGILETSHDAIHLEPFIPSKKPLALNDFIYLIGLEWPSEWQSFLASVMVQELARSKSEAIKELKELGVNTNGL